MIEVLEPRVVLSASVPADIDQFIQDSSNPDGWYAALDVLVPAVAQYAIDQDAAIDGYNSLINSIATNCWRSNGASCRGWKSKRGG